MLNIGIGKNNTHLGDVLITGNLLVEGDVKIDGSTDIDVVIPDPLEVNIIKPSIPGGNLSINNNSDVNIITFNNDSSTTLNGNLNTQNFNVGNTNAYIDYAPNSLDIVADTQIDILTEGEGSIIQMISGSTTALTMDDTEVRTHVPLIADGNLYGGVLAGSTLTIDSTTNATKGQVLIRSDVNMDLKQIKILADPTDGNDASNKNYVDNSLSLYLPLTSGTLTGDLKISKNSIAKLEIENISSGASEIQLTDVVSGKSSLITNTSGSVRYGSGSENNYISFFHNTAGNNIQIISDSTPVMYLSTVDINVFEDIIMNTNRIIGAAGAGQSLTLRSTTNATRGDILCEDRIVAYKDIRIYRDSFVSSTGLPINYARFVQVSDKTISNSTIQSSLISDTGAPTSRDFPSNFFKVGDSFKYRLSGYATTEGGDSDATIRFLIPPTTVISESINLKIGASPVVYWECEITFTFRTIGVGGSCVAFLSFASTEGTDATKQKIYRIGTPTPVAINTTIGLAPEVTFQWALVGANDSITTTQCTLTKIY